jgi:two-component system LytT family response regulator
MSKVRTLIVDDEPLAREGVRSLLESEPDIEIIGECGDGRSAVLAIEKQRPDLVFLDVQMPELDGFGVLETLELESLPVVIFVTAYDQYALKAFEVHALDYLLKPFDRERFNKALSRAKEQIFLRKTGRHDQQLLALLQDLKNEKKFLERLVIKNAGRIFFVKADEISWIEASGNYARLHVGAESHLLRETMNELETKLNPEKFLRIHRSHIVNMEHIKELQPWFQGEYVVILRDGTRLTLSRSYREKLNELLGRAS